MTKHSLWIVLCTRKGLLSCFSHYVPGIFVTSVSMLQLTHTLDILVMPSLLSDTDDFSEANHLCLYPGKKTRDVVKVPKERNRKLTGGVSKRKGSATGTAGRRGAVAAICCEQDVWRTRTPRFRGLPANLRRAGRPSADGSRRLSQARARRGPLLPT